MDSSSKIVLLWYCVDHSGMKQTTQTHQIRSGLIIFLKENTSQMGYFTAACCQHRDLLIRLKQIAYTNNRSSKVIHRKTILGIGMNTMNTKAKIFQCQPLNLRRKKKEMQYSNKKFCFYIVGKLSDQMLSKKCS